MKKLLSRFLFFLLIVTVFAIGADFLLTNSLKKSKRWDYVVLNDLYAGRAQADVTIYGSSRANSHISPEIIKNTFSLESYNLGVNGCGFPMHLLRHNIYLAHNRAPKFIIYSLDYSTFSKRKDLYDRQQFLPHLFDPTLRPMLQYYDGYKLADYFLPLVRFSGQNSEVYHAINIVMQPQKNVSILKKGFAPKSVVSVKVLNDEITLLKPTKIILDSNSIARFHIFLQSCKQQNIDLLFVYTPAYFTLNETTINSEEIMNLYRTLSEKYKIPFYNYSQDSMCYNKMNFKDIDHLNKQGMEIFMQKFLTDARGDLIRIKAY